MLVVAGVCVCVYMCMCVCVRVCENCRMMELLCYSVYLNGFTDTLQTLASEMSMG